MSASWRSMRTLVQSLLAVAIMAAGGAVAGADTTDLRTLGVMAGQAALAAVVAYFHNKLSLK